MSDASSCSEHHCTKLLIKLWEATFWLELNWLLYVHVTSHAKTWNVFTNTQFDTFKLLIWSLCMQYMHFKISSQTRSYHFSVRELIWRERSRMMNASVRCLVRVQRCSIMQCNIRGSLQVTDLKSSIYDALIQYLCGTHEWKREY